MINQLKVGSRYKGCCGETQVVSPSAFCAQVANEADIADISTSNMKMQSFYGAQPANISYRLSFLNWL